MSEQIDTAPVLPEKLIDGQQPLLQIEGLTKQFGGLRAVNNFDLLLYPHNLNGLIGPNGAGKTTVFNMITGVYVPTAGEIIFNQQKIEGFAPHEINQLGIARTFQNIRLFPNLTVPGQRPHRLPCTRWIQHDRCIFS